VTIEKVLQWATLTTVLLGLAGSAATCSRAFDRIENHEERIGKIEKKSEARDEVLSKTLEDLKGSAQYQSWRMDMVIKQLDKTTEKVKR